MAGFLIAVLPLIATPGASLALLVRHVSAGGRRRAAGVVLGTVSGLAVHATLAMAGLSAVVMHSAQAFTAVRLAGALYLVGLGLWCLRSGRSRTASGKTAPGRTATASGKTAPGRTATASGRSESGGTTSAWTASRGIASAQSSPARFRWGGRSAYVQALLGNVLNPKAASIYLTLLPQFVDPHRTVVPQIAVLACAHALLVSGWLIGWTMLLGPAARALRATRMRTALQRFTGLILVGLGLRAAAA
ncbi:LysE family translocator [Kitasatospora paranensis]|uniref:LysE family translocator n=1 Tax=Kitasatospora paranensis TaxID=258053 RepID=A0ABW2FSY1_9ACTN